ncbi:MAG: glycosyltransferase family 2 protein [bacterium]|nr:glycosyltransferase family 2 protein [bacterium]
MKKTTDLPKISVLINTRNEGEKLEKCLGSVSFADEIVVTDMESSDESVSIAKKHHANVFPILHEQVIERARNFGIGKTTGDWILVLDPDEEISETLREKLLEIAGNSSCDFVRIPRKNIIFGRWMTHAGWWPDYLVRFFRKEAISWRENIHSIPETRGKGIELEAREEMAIIHHHYETISQYFERMERYTKVQAEERSAFGYKFLWQDFIRKPLSEFLSRFFFYEGYRDGVHGLALCLLQAFSELVIYLRIWEKEKFSQSENSEKEVFKEITNGLKETNYWRITKSASGSFIKKLTGKIKLKMQRILL